MLIDIPDLAKKYDMNITGVIHCGAHLAEEAPVYDSMGIKTVWWIEAHDGLFQKIVKALKPYPGQEIIPGTLADKDGELVMFNVTNYDSMSSSILEFGTHPEFSPDTVVEYSTPKYTVTLDTLEHRYQIKNCNFLNMDLQGAELLTLKGATHLLYSIDYIYTEVNKAEVYKGCAKIQQLDAYLPDFDRVETFWTPNGWGDALYIRRPV